MTERVDVEGLRALEAKATPGEWRWNVNLSSRCAYLESMGRGRGLEYVMDFARWGMGGAAPRFRSADDLMVRVDELTATVPGREHHERWYRTVTHPDAELIVALRNAAPSLLAEVADGRAEVERVKADNKALSERVNYYERSLCFSHSKFVALQGGAVTGAIEPELIGSVMDQRNSLRAEVAALRAENERMREALTPSGATKAAYIGEFTFEEIRDDHFGDVSRTVPWTTIKEIMAAIRARAALAAQEPR